MVKFKQPTAKQFFTPFQISSFSVSDDESRIIFSSNQNGNPNLFAMDLPHLYPYPLTTIDQTSMFIHQDKKDRFILAGFDNDGDENHQIYALPLNGGEPVPFITNSKDATIILAETSKDGDTFYYHSTADYPTTIGNYTYNINTDEHQLLAAGEDYPLYLTAVSENQEHQVYYEARSNTYQPGFLKNSTDTYSLTPDTSQGHVVHSPVFTDNQTLYFATDFDSDHSYIATYDLTTKLFQKIHGFKNESVTDLQFDKSKQDLLVTTDVGVKHKLYRYNLKNSSIEEQSLPVDQINKLSVVESGNIYLLGESAVSPANIYKFDGQNWQVLTQNRVLGVDKNEMVDPETITYKSFDGLEIEALLFKAPEEVANGYTIFWPHGGPQAAETKHFRAMFQVLINEGYNIFCPNFRGSTGYGSNFKRMVEGDWGHGPRLDNVEGVQWLFDQGISNPDKLFLVGGSYGGYMALLLHGRHPELFKAVIDIFGVSNLNTFYHSVPEHWKPIMNQWVGDPEKEPERFKTDSPITYLETMTKPMLVIQGAKDPRVVKEESDQIVNKLTELGRDVDYLVLEDEGHGFSKKANEIKVLQTMIEFLEKHQ